MICFADQKLEAIFALLEAFGNVSTPLNQNASRFTLLVSMDFDSAGLLTSASVQVSGDYCWIFSAAVVFMCDGDLLAY